MGLFGKSYNSWEKEFLYANRDKYTATMTMFNLEDDGKTDSKMYKKVKAESEKLTAVEKKLIEKYPKFHERYVNNRGTDKQTKLSEKANRGEKI